jgi:hypothetical protein
MHLLNTLHTKLDLDDIHGGSKQPRKGLSFKQFDGQANQVGHVATHDQFLQPIDTQSSGKDLRG